VRNRSASILVRIVSILFLSATIIVTTTSLINFSRQRSNYPAGMTIGGIPVGGLDPQATSERVLQVYSSPVELRYGEAIIHIDPTTIGFEVDIESMLAEADLRRTGSSFWAGFWDYLWNRTPPPEAIPLSANLSEDRLRNYLETEIAPRYDTPSEPAQPIPGTTNFAPGTPGQALDIDRAVILIEDALRSPTNRVVSLSFRRSAPARPTIENLNILLQQTVQVAGFDGVLGLYMLDLQTGQEIHFGMDGGEIISVQPDISFTSSSMVKIPIMVSYFIKYGPDGLTNENNAELLLNMIRLSENPPADRLMELLNINTGPLVVTEDMQELGLENTFIAGFFCDPINPCPLLRRYETPANQRVDVFTDPDPFNQTTPSDMGMLLSDIYQCANMGGGALVAAFPDKITKEICQQMINYLAANKIGVLIEAGVPEGTQVAHKHGWISDPRSQVIQNISDAAIVYTPGGNYVLVINAYHPVQALWEPVSTMFAQLSQAVYNYYNLPNQ
jgi:beta-lactamase class A